jgi:hypothetical protein
LRISHFDGSILISSKCHFPRLNNAAKEEHRLHEDRQDGSSRILLHLQVVNKFHCEQVVSVNGKGTACTAKIKWRNLSTTSAIKWVIQSKWFEHIHISTYWNYFPFQFIISKHFDELILIPSEWYCPLLINYTAKEKQGVYEGRQDGSSRILASSSSEDEIPHQWTSLLGIEQHALLK